MKTVIVTGASRGIGRGVALMLARRGYRVLATYARDDEAAREVAESSEGRVQFFKADQSDRRQTYEFANFVKSQTDALHCVVCNAGITVRHAFDETTDADWDTMLEVAVNSHFILLRELSPLLQEGGRILFTGSTMGRYPHATILGYGVVKAAVHAMAQNLVKVFAPRHITVNTIAPGFVETDWQKNKPETVRQNIYRKTAAGRFATIDEVVDAYAFCLDNPFVNGAVLEVNGGYDYA